MKPDIELGKLITNDQERDAIHIAIVPVIVNERMKPGQHVSIYSNTDPIIVTKNGSNNIGIIDPFLPTSVAKGKKCWLFLYQNTITSLKHVWSHPLLPDKATAIAMQNTFDELTKIPESRRWLTEYAHRELDMTYEELMAAADDHLNSGETCILSFDTPNAVYDLNDAFWSHYETVKKTTIPRAAKVPFFSCTC